MMKNRPGFTLGEVMVALVLTGVIGAAVTGVFISQSRFFDVQEKAGSARAVSRGAVNILMSELRMVERGGGVIEAGDSVLRVRVPYRMGIVCATAAGGVWASLLPADPSVTASAVYAGYAYRNPANGAYTYMEGGVDPTPPVGSNCSPAVTIMPNGGNELRLRPTAPATVGTAVFLYQIVEYEFKASTSVPGSRALWRQVGNGTSEELIAPFSNDARFRYYINDAAAPAAAPGGLATITGVHLTLSATSERKNSNGTTRVIPYTTSVYFRNRL